MENVLIRALAMVLFVTAVIVIFCCYFSYQETQTGTDTVINELKSIPLEEDHLGSIKSKECKEIEKNEKVWIVKNCNDDVYFKIFLDDDSYTLGRCVEWNTPREAFLKLKEQLLIKDCVDQQAEDKLIREFDSFKMYEVCGLRLVFRDECIVGIGTL